MDQQKLESTLADLPLGWVRYFQSTGSTNRVAAFLAEEGAPDFTLVVADEQTAGRGRAGRNWFTAPGAALAFSMVFKGMGEIANLSQVIGLGALAVSGALEKRFSLSPRIKWPNDILVRGRKLSGVLTEAHWSDEQLTALILGIGINIAPASIPLESALSFPATCVRDELEGTQVSSDLPITHKIDRLDLLHAVLVELLYWRPKVDTPEFIQNWDSRLAFRDQWVRVIFDGLSDIEGFLCGLNSDGSLRLRLRSGEEITLRTGEIRLRPVDSENLFAD